MVNSGGYKDKPNSQSSFDEYLFTGPYEDTEWIADLQIGHGPNPESSEFFNSSWINEGSQAAGTVEASMAQGLFWTASGIQLQENQTAAGIQTLTQQPLSQREFFNSSWTNEGSQAAGTVEASMAQGLFWAASGIQLQENQTVAGIQTLTQQRPSQPGDMSTLSRKNIRKPWDAKEKWLQKKRGHDKAYRERVKQKRQRLEDENLEKDEQMKAFQAEIGRLHAENAEIRGHEQLVNSNLVELNAENESLKEENLVLNQRLHTKSRELDQLQNKVNYSEKLHMILKKRLKKLAKEMEDMRVQTAATEAAQEDEIELQSFKKQSDQFLISKMIIRVKAECAFLDALFTEIPNNESDSNQPTR